MARDDIEDVFNEAFKLQEQLQKKHQEGLRQLEAVAQEGKKAGKTAGLVVAAITVAVLCALGWVMLRDPQYRPIFGFMLLLVLFFAAWRFWKTQS